jgi:hypothetical protein
MRFVGVRGSLLASSLLVGCVNDGVRPCDLWTAAAVVAGRVTDSSGAAIVDAVVEVEIAATGACDAAGDWAHSRRVTTDANGNYSAEVELGNARGIRCVRSTEMASGTSARGAVEFVGGCDETRPPGELRINLVIP